MAAEEYLRDYLGGNMNVKTLTPFAIAEVMDKYAKSYARQIAQEAVDGLRGTVLPEADAEERFYTITVSSGVLTRIKKITESQ